MAFVPYNIIMKQALSVIIPTFNEEEYLPKLLKSLRLQTLAPREIIVADAFSTDKTRKIARSFGCKLIDGGLPAVARNNGAKIAREPLLLFLDADVVLPRSFLEKTVDEMTKRNLDIASCYILPRSPLKVDQLLHKLINQYFRLTQKFHPHIPGFCIFVRSKLHNRIGGFDESIVLCEDLDYVTRTKKIGKFAYLKSFRVPVSVRRLTKEGRINLTLKYIAMELHMIFLGKIRKDIFNYKFGNYK